jgi:mycofactocin precursor
MSELATIAEPAGATAVVPDEEPATAATAGPDPIAVADLLVEEVSIDGMCGVY